MAAKLKYHGKKKSLLLPKRIAILSVFLYASFFLNILDARASITRTFKGEIDFVNESLMLDVYLNDNASVKIKGIKSGDTTYKINANVENLITPLFDISTELSLLIDYYGRTPNNVGLLKGSLKSQYSLLNHKPIREFSGNFHVKNNTFYLNSLAFGNLTGSGNIQLQYPYKQEGALFLNAVSLDKFLDFWISEKTFDSEGTVTGEIKSSGDLSNVVLKGKLNSFNGYIKELYFDSIELNLEGTYPLMVITDSVLSTDTGFSYTFQGPFDLSKKGTFKKQIKELTLAPLIESTESDLEWTIKRVGQKESSSTELKYLLREEQTPGAAEDQKSGMLGIEHKMKF